MPKAIAEKEIAGKTPVGIIGLGIMGFPMARNLAAAGHPLFAYNRTSKADAVAAFGGKTVLTPREAAEKARVLITMVTGPEALGQVMAGPQGFLAAKNKDLAWIQTSTIDPGSTQAFASVAKMRGWTFLDCPVTGSKKQVEAAELILLAGGESAVLESLRPLLLRLGKAIVHAGDVGAGTALKLCMNMIVAQMTTALAEAVTLAEHTGLEPARLFDVLKHSPALDCGYFRIKEQALLKRDFTPAFSLANMLKDVRFMTAEAKKKNLTLPVTEAVKTLMEKALAEGLGDKDLSALLLTLTPSHDHRRN